MTIYCFSCCDYCTEFESCSPKDGGCAKCDYWIYGECSNPRQYKNRLIKIQEKYTQMPSTQI